MQYRRQKAVLPAVQQQYFAPTMTPSTTRFHLPSFSHGAGEEYRSCNAILRKYILAILW
jgi:hypothetical protein